MPVLVAAAVSTLVVGRNGAGDESWAVLLKR
jgi:hypothetical protein